MAETRENYYGSLCTEMYEILHPTAPKDELDFYLSYAEKGKAILEALCGSGRFFVPFIERGFDIEGLDNSAEMLGKLKEKVPDAKVTQCNVEDYQSDEKFDYIFISSGSVSLFTDMDSCKSILAKMKSLLKEGGKFVFAVDTVATICPDDNDYKVTMSEKTADGLTLLGKGKNFYDKESQTQLSPGFYELYDGEKLLQSEFMDFRIHLYKFGEMDKILKEIGFDKIKVYSTFDKKIAQSDKDEMFLYECSL